MGTSHLSGTASENRGHRQPSLVIQRRDRIIEDIKRRRRDLVKHDDTAETAIFRTYFARRGTHNMSMGIPCHIYYDNTMPTTN